MVHSLFLEGVRQDRFTYIKRAPGKRRTAPLWFCVCDCGKEFICEKDTRRKSCGCPPDRHLNPEEWKRIPAAPYYMVSVKGEVFSLKSNKILKFGYDGHGYRFFNGKGKSISVHRSVASAFIPNPLNLPCALHKDGNKINNTPENLYWGTKKDNAADKARHGTRLNGEKISTSKLKNAQVLYVRSSNKTSVSLADELGVHAQTIRSIRRRKTWRHV